MGRKPLAALVIAAASGLAVLSGYIALSAGNGRGGTLSSQVERSGTRGTHSSRKAITALGRLEPKGGVIRVAAPYDPNLGPPIVRKLHVKERDRVEADQILAVLDSGARLDAAAREARAKLATAEARLAETAARMRAGEIAAQEADVARLQTEYDLSASQHRRDAELFQAGLIAPATLDERRTAMRSHAQKLQQAREVLNQLRVMRAVEVQSAEADRGAAAAAVARAEVERRQAIVRSPLPGQILDVYAHEGEHVDSRGVLAIGRTDEMYAVAEVYESDAPLVRIGQSAVVTGAGISDEISGVVEEIGLLVRKNDIVSTDPAAEADARIVKVKIRLNTSAPIAGLTSMRVICSIRL